MIIDGFDTETYSGRGSLIKTIRNVVGLAQQIAAIDALAGRIPQGNRSEPGVVMLLEKLAAERRDYQEQLDKAPAPRPARRQQQPDRWAELAQSPEKPSKDAGDIPYAPVELLERRLRQAARGERPQICTRRVRTASSRAAEFVTVDAATVGQVLTAAPDLWTVKAGWPSIRQAFAKMANEPKYARPATDNDEEALFAKVQVDPECPNDKNSYRDRFVEGWQNIRAMVEAEVLDQVGLPKRIEIVSPARAQALSEPAYYDAPKQISYFKPDAVSAERIAHEFGHHIEENGPAEIWLGCAALLNRLSEGRPLEPKSPPTTRVPTYALNFQLAKIPNPGYAASYYDDGGTELLALGMELWSWRDVRGEIPAAEAKVQEGDQLGADYILLLLHALRPREMRENGFPQPSLL